MNLLDTASLVVTPNGYKASKLYSIVPSDGSGDMTFARTGDTATRVNSSGLIETVLADKPRLDYTSSTCPKLLLEPQRTNIILQSQDISSASWTKTNSPTIVSNSAVAPDGTTTADSIQDTTGTTYKSIGQSFSVSANSTYTFSIFIKKESSRTNYGGIYFEFTGGTYKFVHLIFDETIGSINALSGATIPTVLKTENFGNYWKFTCTLTDTGSNTTLNNLTFATLSINGTTISAANGSARTIWGMQLEAGAYATSYIPTTTASVTRNADSCVKTTITSLLGQTEGTIFADINFNKASVAFIDFVSMTGTNVVEIQYNNSDGKIYFVYYQAGDLCRIPSTTTIIKGNRYKLAGAYKNNDFIFYINGVQQGTDTSGTITGSLTNFGINGGYSPSQANNEIVELNSAAHWKTRLTNQELVTLTTI